MRGLYKRGRVWWFCHKHNERYYRLSTGETDEALAQDIARKILDGVPVEAARRPEIENRRAINASRFEMGLEKLKNHFDARFDELERLIRESVYQDS